MVATSKSFLNQFSFFCSSSRRDPDCDRWRLHWGS